MDKTKVITRDELTQAFEKTAKEFDIAFPLDDVYDIDRLFNEVDLFGLKLNVMREDNEEDTWLKATYWSDKLGKGIVWSYDWDSRFETMDEFIDKVLAEEEAIREFDAKLPVLNPVLAQ